MSGEQRILLAFEMSLFARELAKEGIRWEHPEWPETVMKEYVDVPDAMLQNTKELKKYLEFSYEYAKTLKPKPSRKKS